MNLFTELGQPDGQFATWDSLGFAHRQLGNYERALDCYRNAITLVTELDEQSEEAEVYVHLGDCHDAAGDEEAAKHAWRRAIDLFDQLNPARAEKLRQRVADQRS